MRCTDSGRVLEVYSAEQSAVLPDRLDPPVHPGHRSAAHALTPAAAAAALWGNRIDIGQSLVRQLADRHAWLRASRPIRWSEPGTYLSSLSFEFFPDLSQGSAQGA